MLQFSLSRIFLCTTLIAIGVALLVFAFSNRTPGADGVLHMVIYHIGGGFIGAGIATPFTSRVWIGAALGILLAFAILAAFCV